MESTPGDAPAPISTGVNADQLSTSSFRPALIVVDVQNDFLPPDGPVAVPGGREVIPLINELLSSQGFVLKIATLDWHPDNHISFAENHPPPNNIPYKSEVATENPMFAKIDIDVPNNAKKAFKTKSQRLWPKHGVENTHGAQYAEGLNWQACDVHVKKGMDPRVDMYSVFTDAFGNMDCLETGGVSHDVLVLLKEAAVTDVFVVGLAADLCVKSTALDSAGAGFRTWIIEEGTRPVDKVVWEEMKIELSHGGVSLISLASEKMRQLRSPEV
ncbi:NAD(+) salvage pathway protein [Ascosphaera aggregata]|nr:NAD(+) salvage pathway protein [Ascosphaera aggregata]